MIKQVFVGAAHKKRFLLFLLLFVVVIVAVTIPRVSVLVVASVVCHRHRLQLSNY